MNTEQKWTNTEVKQRFLEMTKEVRSRDEESNERYQAVADLIEAEGLEDTREFVELLTQCR